MRNGQSFLVDIILSVILVLFFTSIAMNLVKINPPSTKSLALAKRGLSALNAISSTGAIEKLIQDDDDSAIRLILNNVLPPNTYYNLTIIGYSSDLKVYNKEDFQVETVIRYVYTSIQLRRTFILILNLSVGEKG